MIFQENCFSYNIPLTEQIAFSIAFNILGNMCIANVSFPGCKIKLPSSDCNGTRTHDHLVGIVPPPLSAGGPEKFLVLVKKGGLELF